nr:hypothetical protein [Chlamydiifrater volucris]
MNQTAAPIVNTTSNSNSAFASKGDSSVVQEGALKTQVGTLIFSCECSSETMENASQAVQTICSQNILESSGELFSASRLPMEQEIIFLSPETVSLEIEVKDLLLELQKPDTEQGSTSNKPITLSRGPIDNPLLLPKSPLNETNSLSNFNNSSKPTQEKTSSETSEQKALPDSLERNSLSLLSPQKSDRGAVKNISLLSPDKSNSSVRLSLVETKTFEQGDSLQTTESSSQSSKDQGEESSRQDSGRDSEQNSKEDREEDTSPNETKKTYSSQKKEQTLGIDQLLFQYNQSTTSTPMSKREAPSPNFQKKSASPMAFFSSSLSSQSKKGSSGRASISVEKNSSQVEDSSNENIFLRFMRLMARILGQAEAEAHELYLKVKARTDDVESLTLLISKINATKGDVDWSKDPEMMALVDRAKRLGVVVPNSNYKWTEEEKKMFRENIQMRKENMEKITQLERTDMQRLLQEVSQCHQARSNVLKLLKELMDTFIYNLRP